ncbi:MAG: tetrahydromethanopterin S-methyltransferase subunit H [Candidatus Bathyarchaeia archaeon]|jgi:tetrahydromethanopterin S-methyltransferase subunit H
MTFKTMQTVACINGVNVGGQPGENPTCIIPSIFYDGHKIVTDPVKGEFNKAQAETLLNKVEELSEKTGNPFFIDIMGINTQALTKYVNFVSELTCAPFLVDSVSRDAKLQTMAHIQKNGLINKAIYNSLNFLSTPQELQTLKELDVKSAVVLAYDPKTPADRLAVLSGDSKQPGLLGKAQQVGVTNLLVDTAVMKLTSIGAASKAVCSVKEAFGLPVGCSPANAISVWKKLQDGEFGPDALKVCVGASALFTQTMAADFVIAGRIDYVDAVFAACALGDAVIAAETQGLGVKTAANHPYYKIL